MRTPTSYPSSPIAAPTVAAGLPRGTGRRRPSSSARTSSPRRRSTSSSCSESTSWSCARSGSAGARLGRDVPAVWLEHNAPQGRINHMRHPGADRHDVSAIVHVTPTNALFWDNGDKPVRVIEHGIVDPGERWTGEDAACGVVVNEPVRRGRVAGADLLPRFGHAAPVRVFGMAVNRLTIVARRSELAARTGKPRPGRHAR